MAQCVSKITADIIFDCALVGKKGLDANRVVLINYTDIDRTATTVASAVMSALSLVSGATGFAVEFYKDLGSANSAYAPSTEEVDGFTHSLLLRLPSFSAANSERARELKDGRFVAVVETKYKGDASKDAFKVYGYENGMTLSELTADTAANGGAMPFTIATTEGEYEPYPYLALLETDYATTKASFNANFKNV